MPTPVLKLLSAAANTPTDADLLGRFVTSRDEAAFAELVRRHGAGVYRVCQHLVGSSSADDAFQATFLVLACRAKSIRKSGSVGSWLIGVAGRVSRQMRRRGHRVEEAERRSPTDPGRTISHPPPETGLLAAELASVLDDELTRLPDVLRGPVVLCLLEGRTQEQAATELGGSIRSLRRRLDRAKALLRLRLERRGMVPTVAAGLVCGVGHPSAAISPALARQAVSGVFKFLAEGGGVSTPAAVVAKGVVGSMTRLKVSAVMAVATAVLIAVGIVGADELPGRMSPSSASVVPLPPAEVAAAPPVEPATPVPPRPVERSPRDRGPTAAPPAGNFIVHAPTRVIARVVAAEAEFRRQEFVKRWLVRARGFVAVETTEIRVTLADGADGGKTSFTLKPHPSLRMEPPVMVIGPRMELRGALETILSTHLPREVARTALVGYLPKPPSPWADAGISLTQIPDETQAGLDAECRKLMGAGRGQSLLSLFRTTTPPSDAGTFDAQAYSVVRFLLSRQPNADVGPVVWNERGQLRAVMPNGGPTGPGVIAFDPENRPDSLLAFVWAGMTENTPESWDRAAKEVYGVESVAWLERAWKGWLDNPKSEYKPQPELPPAPLASPLPPSSPQPLLPPPAVGPPGQPGPTHRTANFIVSAPTADMSRQIGTAAERYRKELARTWLGKELPDWPEPCPIGVKITPTAGGGASTFTFQPTGKNRVPGFSAASMDLHGPFKSVLGSLLPHEVLHAVLASHFGRALPRWADEGIALTAEPPEEQAAHAIRVRELLDAGRGLRLKVLFRMVEYPRDMMVLYAQGYSVVRFLLTRDVRTDGGGFGYSDGRPNWMRRAVNVPGGSSEIQIRVAFDPKDRNDSLLAFVGIGMSENTPGSWDKAAGEVYGFESVDALEQAWLDWLRKDAGQQKIAPSPTPAVPGGDKPDLIPPTKLSAAEPRPDPAATHDFASRKITVPIRIEQEKRGSVREVRVMTSGDEGKTWRTSGTISPDKDRFVYEAPTDGVYWLTAVVVSRDGRQEPADLARVSPAVKIRVDTTPPVVTLTDASRTADGVTLNWTVEEAHPDGAVRVQYRPVGGDWVDVTPPAASSLGVRFSPETAEPIDVRVVARDRAGNSGSVVRRLAAP